MASTRRQAFALAIALLGACSKGGGGSGDSLPPQLVGAAFAGATSTPAAGDQLLLSFSEPVTASAGAALGGADVTLSGGASLGTTTVLDQPTTRSVRLQLGSGVTFVAGSTTFAFTDENRVVADIAGNFARSGTAVTIEATDGAAPTISSLTLDAIDAALNGTGPAGGTLQVPPGGFVVDLTYTDTGSPGGPLGVDPARTQILASVAVNSSAGLQTAGTNLLPLLTAVTASTTRGSYSVPTTMTFASGPVTLTAIVVDGGGLASAAATFSFTVHAWTDALRPFETSANSQQVWFLDTSRDIESFTTTPVTGGATVNVVATANGRSDYLDVLYVLGLQSTSPIANVSGGLDSNQVVLQRLQNGILANLALLYAGANITFTFSQPTGSFGSNSSVAYASLGYSQICVAGSDDNSALKILGVAQLDPNNQRQNNDCLLETATTSRLGVFLHTIADSGLSPPSGTLFHLHFNPFATAVGGTPIGEAVDGLDGQRLVGTTTDTRATRLDSAIDGLARFVAVIAAHECGHSMGLVVNGPMPTGLYGNDTVNFPGSSDGHIRTQALFPSGGTNVMSPQLSYDLATDSHTAFNSLNLAYLREQALYGN